MPRMTAQTARIVETALHLWETMYQPLDIVPTVRALFYRLAVLGVVDKSQAGYDRVQRALARAREQGSYPWNGIYDGLRQLVRPQTWTSLESYVEVVRNSYSKDKWRTQPRLIECWIEKDTLVGTIDSVIQEYELPLLVDRGYLSVTAKMDATRRLKTQPRTIIYIGDHDPSGLNMLDEAKEWMEQMLGYGVDVDIERIAITDEDHDNTDLPHLPVNHKDSRTPDYVERYGEEVVEVEALPPEDLQRRLREALEPHIDRVAWGKVEREQATERKRLRKWLEGKK